MNWAIFGNLLQLYGKSIVAAGNTVDLDELLCSVYDSEGELEFFVSTMDDLIDDPSGLTAGQIAILDYYDDGVVGIDDRDYWLDQLIRRYVAVTSRLPFADSTPMTKAESDPLNLTTGNSYALIIDSLNDFDAGGVGVYVLEGSTNVCYTNEGRTVLASHGVGASNLLFTNAAATTYNYDVFRDIRSILSGDSGSANRRRFPDAAVEVTVYIRGGDYTLDRECTLVNQDASGSPTPDTDPTRIVIRNYPGEVVNIYCGNSTGSTAAMVTVSRPDMKFRGINFYCYRTSGADRIFAPFFMAITNSADRCELSDCTIGTCRAIAPDHPDAGTLPGYVDSLMYSRTAHTGTATAGGATSIQLAVGASGSNDTYNGLCIEITSGTGSGQSRAIVDYAGSTRTVTVAAWSVVPDATSVYKVYVFSKGQFDAKMLDYSTIQVGVGNDGTLLQDLTVTPAGDDFPRSVSTPGGATETDFGDTIDVAGSSNLTLRRVKILGTSSHQALQVRVAGDGTIADGLLVEYCEIRNPENSCIGIGANNSIVRYNRIYDFGSRTDAQDAGGIQCGHGNSLEIYGNVIWCDDDQASGQTWGIDIAVSQVDTSLSFVNNTIRNNILYRCGMSFGYSSSPPAVAPGRVHDNTVSENVFYGLSDYSLTEAAYNAPISTILGPNVASFYDNTFDGNSFFRYDGDKTALVERLSSGTTDWNVTDHGTWFVNNTYANPQFVDPEGGDFNVDSSSAVSSLIVDNTPLDNESLAPVFCYTCPTEFSTATFDYTLRYKQGRLDLGMPAQAKALLGGTP